MSGRNSSARGKGQDRSSQGQTNDGHKNSSGKGQKGSEILSDTIERSQKEVPPIATRRLQDSDVYNGKKINPSVIREHFLQEGRLKEETALRILREAKEVQTKMR